MLISYKYKHIIMEFAFSPYASMDFYKYSFPPILQRHARRVIVRIGPSMYVFVCVYVS